MNLDEFSNRLGDFGIKSPPINLGAMMGQPAQMQAPQMPQIPFSGMLSGGGSPGSFNPWTFIPAFRQWMSQRQTPIGNGELRNLMQQRPQRPGMPRPPQQGRAMPGGFPQFPMGFGGR